MAVLLEIPIFELRAILEDEKHPAYRIYQKNLAIIARQIRQRDLELANAGSAVAAEAVVQHFRRMTEDL